MAELEEKLQLKRKMSAANAALEVARILSFSRMVTITKTLQGIAPDPDDDMVLECAVVVRVSHIVTGDRDFLSLSRYQDIAIVSAADFLTLLS